MVAAIGLAPSLAGIADKGDSRFHKLKLGLGSAHKTDGNSDDQSRGCLTVL